MWTSRFAIAGIIAGAVCLSLPGCATAGRDQIAAQINLGVTRAVENVRESRALTRQQIDAQTDQIRSDAKYQIASAASALVTAMIVLVRQHTLAKGLTHAKPD